MSASPLVVNGRIQRNAHLRWLRVGDLHPSPVAQREKLNQTKVNRIAAHLDMEKLGYPTINVIGDQFRIIDGWHRIEALKAAGFKDLQLQVQTYVGLTEEEEADMFLILNDTLAVDAFSKFRAGVNANRPVESDINRIVLSNGLSITHNTTDGGIHSPATLVRIYNRSGGEVLGRTLRIIRDAYGTSGLEATVIDGVALVVTRYADGLKDDRAVEKLGSIHGGVRGLIGKANSIKANLGQPKNQCMADAVVRTINGGRANGRSKLTPWWRS